MLHGCINKNFVNENLLLVVRFAKILCHRNIVACVCPFYVVANVDVYRLLLVLIMLIQLYQHWFQELQLQKVKDELRRSKALIDVDEKKLADWDQLMDQWSQTSNELTNKDQRIQVC